MRWLITGGCGFIGTSLVKQLMQDRVHQVRVIDNLSVGSLDDLARACDFIEVRKDVQRSLAQFDDNGCVQFIHGDILDDALAVVLGQGSDIIVHLAANTGVALSVEDPRKDCVTNVIGTLNYLESARINNVKRFVFASSGAPIGECEPPIHEEMAPHPVSPYGASKLAGEAYCSAYSRTFGVDTVALRFGNVYGPGSGHKTSVVAKFIRSALEGTALRIYGDGAQTRDFIYIDDLIEAVWRAACAPNIGGEVFQIATSSETSVQELVDLLIPILARLGVSLPRVDYETSRRGDVRRNFSDTSKSLRLLNWRAHVEVADGLERTARWFVSGIDN